MNRAILIGNAVDKAETGQTESGVAYARFRMAVSRSYKNADGSRDADFFTVVCWRGLAEIAGRYVKKGGKVAVVGSMQNRSYEVNGAKRQATELIADGLELLGGSREQEAPPEEPPAYRPQTGSQMSMAQTGFTQVDDDELPF